MSKADVTFLTIEGKPCPEGDLPARFTFRCVNWNKGRHPALSRIECGRLLIVPSPHSAQHGIARHPTGEGDGRPQWDWDGNREAPTFSPSINCGGHCGWHGYLRAGRCVDTQNADEPEN